MAKRSAIDMLPEDIRRQFEQRLVDSGFSNYTDLADWLATQGYEISRSSVHRAGSKFQQRLDAVKRASQQAVEIVKYFPDDDAMVSQATVRMVQGRLMDLLVEEDDLEPAALAKIARAIADITRTDMVQRLKLEELRDKIKDKLAELEKEVKRGATPEELESKIREVYGFVQPQP